MRVGSVSIASCKTSEPNPTSIYNRGKEGTHPVLLPTQESDWEPKNCRRNLAKHRGRGGGGRERLPCDPGRVKYSFSLPAWGSEITSMTKRVSLVAQWVSLSGQLKLLREKFNFCEARQYGIISFLLPFHLPDVNHLLTEKHWLQLIVTTAGEGTVESVLAATWVTGTSDVTLKVKYIPVWKIKRTSSHTSVVLFRAFKRHWRNRTFGALHCNKESPIY